MYQELLGMLGMRVDTTKELVVISLILARTLPMVFMTPFLGAQMIPSEVKMGLAATLAIIVWPLARYDLPHEIPVMALTAFALLMKESLIGFLIGFAASHIFSAMEVAGRLIDTARGSAMAEVMVPSTKARATIVGNIYHQLLLVIFVTLGGHRIFIEAYLHSFATLPLTGGIDLTPGWGPMALFMCRATGDILLTAVILAMPALAATFIADLVFGILNRVAPQLNAYFLSMPVKAMGALAMMLVGMPAFMARLQVYMRSILMATERAIELLTPH